ncbi:MAG: DMT family transporter [Clostridia bacterium]|nr:DMT family transporter [Clostridia bacterium]
MKSSYKNFFAVLAALIWGLAFSAQSYCAEKGMGAFTFNALRALIATVVLFFVCIIFSKGTFFSQLKDRKYLSSLLAGGAVCGTILFLATNFQQSAFSSDTESGKVGFITVLYIVLVPIFSIIFKKKATPTVWVSVVIAIIGMYFLCIEEGSGFNINYHDLLALACAVLFSFHILFIDRFASKVNGIQLSFVQFAVVTVLSGACALFTEAISPQLIVSCFWQIAYVGVFSSGVAYTLQIIAQKDSNPTVISLLLSLESVFAVLGGAVILGEVMSIREYIGCGIMFCAVILAQLPERNKKNEA